MQVFEQWKERKGESTLGVGQEDATKSRKSLQHELSRDYNERPPPRHARNNHYVWRDLVDACREPGRGTRYKEEHATTLVYAFAIGAIDVSNARVDSHDTPNGRTRKQATC